MFIFKVKYVQSYQKIKLGCNNYSLDLWKRLRVYSYRKIKLVCMIIYNLNVMQVESFKLRALFPLNKVTKHTNWQAVNLRHACCSYKNVILNEKI